MGESGSTRLLAALDLRLSEILRIDFWLGMVGAVGGALLGAMAPERLLAVVPLLAGLVGVILGSVLAAVAILIALLDQPFLRKIRAIGRTPTYYLAPFLFTAVLAVVSLLSLIGVALMTRDIPGPVLSVGGGIMGLLAIWTVASPIPLLETLVQFIGLKMDALDVPDDIGEA